MIKTPYDQDMEDCLLSDKMSRIKDLTGKENSERLSFNQVIGNNMKEYSSIAMKDKSVFKIYIEYNILSNLTSILCDDDGGSWFMIHIYAIFGESVTKVFI